MLPFMRITEESVKKDAFRRTAILQSGYDFIVLQLKDRKKRRVSAVDDIVAHYTETPGEFKFEVVSRQLQFEPDVERAGMMTAHVLDTEHNRKFLASHLNCSYWKLISVISGGEGKSLVLKEVAKELDDLRIELENKSINPHSGHGKVPNLLPETNQPFDVSSLSDDVIEKEMKRRNKAKIIDVGARVPGNKPGTKDSASIEEISDEEFKKLTPGQKGKVTKARNKREKNVAIMESSVENNIVIDSNTEVVVSKGESISSFLKPSRIGVAPP